MQIRHLDQSYNARPDRIRSSEIFLMDKAIKEKISFLYSLKLIIEKYSKMPLYSIQWQRGLICMRHHEIASTIKWGFTIKGLVYMNYNDEFSFYFSKTQKKKEIVSIVYDYICVTWKVSLLWVNIVGGHYWSTFYKYTWNKSSRS